MYLSGQGCRYEIVQSATVAMPTNCDMLTVKLYELDISFHFTTGEGEAKVGFRKDGDNGAVLEFFNFSDPFGLGYETVIVSVDGVQHYASLHITPLNAASGKFSRRVTYTFYKDVTP